jgi:integrase
VNSDLASLTVTRMEVRAMAIPSLVQRARQSHSRKALTPEEITKVLAIASESKRNLAMILFAYRHGMRASEVCDLRLADVDLKNGQITIRRLKGSLTTTQPLSDLPGQPLLSERRVLRAWPPSVATRAILCSRHRRAAALTARHSSVCSNPSRSGRACQWTGGIHIA